MSTQKGPWQPVLLVLPTFTPTLAVEILPHGLTVHKLYVQADGKTHDIVLGPEIAKDFNSQFHRYHNTIIGRYSNRVPVGEHKLERNGITSLVKIESNESPKVSLHGGITGFDQLDWDVIDLSESKLFNDKEKQTIGSSPSFAVFRLVSPDGDQGYPGTLLVEVLVGLLNPGQTTITTPKDEYGLGSIFFVYRAKIIDEGKKIVTPVNLTQHWGFNLDASLHDKSSLQVKDHHLTIQADSILELDPVFLSTGNLSPVAGTAHQHSAKLIGDTFPNPGYDFFYVFNRPANVPVAPGRVPLSTFDSVDLLKEVVEPDSVPGSKEYIVELSSVKSGLRLGFDSNQSGVQFYTGNFVSKDSARKKIHGGTGALGAGDGYGPVSAAFLEFHEPLAAWLHPGTTPTGNDTLLTSDELYHNFVKVDVMYHNPDAL